MALRMPLTRPLCSGPGGAAPRAIQMSLATMHNLGASVTTKVSYTATASVFLPALMAT